MKKSLNFTLRFVTLFLFLSAILDSACSVHSTYTKTNDYSNQKKDLFVIRNSVPKVPVATSPPQQKVQLQETPAPTKAPSLEVPPKKTVPDKSTPSLPAAQPTTPPFFKPQALPELSFVPFCNGRQRHCWRVLRCGICVNRRGHRHRYCKRYLSFCRRRCKVKSGVCT